MKKSIVAPIGAMGMCCALAHAQSSVTLYGTLDTGIEYVSHASASGKSVVRMPAITGSIPSRWGLRGQEGLGAGYKAVFVLENGFNLNQGTLGQGGRLFGRQAWVGIEGPFGRLSLGRQYTDTFNTFLANDILGPAIYGIAALDPYIPNARGDNSVAYSGTFGRWTLGAVYALGRDSAGTGNSPGQGICPPQVSGGTIECRLWSASIRYDAPSWGLAVAYEEQRGGKGAAANFFDGVTPAPLSMSADKDARLLVNGSATIGSVRLVGGWLNRRVAFGTSAVPEVRSDLFYVGGSYAVTPTLRVNGEVYRIVNGQHDTRATLSTLEVLYLLSKRSAVYGMVSYLANSPHAQYSVSAGGGGTTPAPGVGQTGVMIGVRSVF